MKKDILTLVGFGAASVAAAIRISKRIKKLKQKNTENIESE